MATDYNNHNALRALANIIVAMLNMSRRIRDSSPEARQTWRPIIDGIKQDIKRYMRDMGVRLPQAVEEAEQQSQSQARSVHLPSGAVSIPAPTTAGSRYIITEDGSSFACKIIRVVVMVYFAVSMMAEDELDEDDLLVIRRVLDRDFLGMDAV